MSDETKIVECVPNFSEGRDSAVIESITASIREVDSVSLLDVDPGHATNRTVVTFVGPPEQVLEAAFRAIRTASRLIDMSTHKGAHPRMGATDVCPFVPVSGIDLEGCAQLARQLGARVGEELGIPIYLYEAAASTPQRHNLADVRAGEYEGLENRLATPDWAPDFGPASFNSRSGATAIGARPFLIAYNVNLNTRETRKAMKIAALIREKGIIRRDSQGRIIRDEDGRALRDPGMFKSVKAIGWFIEEYDRCQISMNLTNYHVSPPHLVVDAIRRVADQEGVVVTGSELVGLIPLDAMLQAGRHYLVRQGLNPGAPESELIELAIRSLGLRELGPFDPNERIVERRIRSDGPLVQKSIRDFTDTLSSSAPAPGGGSVAALCGALSSALSAMVGSLTTGKKGYENLFQQHNENAVKAQSLKESFLDDIDKDTAAFDQLMVAFGLPRRTAQEKAQREKAIQEATKHATMVPLAVLRRCAQTIECAEVALSGNANARSDAGVAVLLARTCAEGAWYNVSINLKGIDDPEFRQQISSQADEILQSISAKVEELSTEVRDYLRES